MWDLIVSVPDHCLSFYFTVDQTLKAASRILFKYFLFVTYMTKMI